MCMAGPELMLISAGISAFGQYQQSQAQANAMERQAQIDRRNAEIQNQQQAALDAARRTNVERLANPYQQLGFVSDVYRGTPTSQCLNPLLPAQSS